MFSLWKQSTTLFVLQVAAFMIGLLVMDNWQGALKWPMLCTFAYSLLGFVPTDHWHRSTIWVWASGLPAAIGGLLFIVMVDTGFKDAGVRIMAAVFLLGAIALAAGAAYESFLHDRTHPWWQRFVAALPLGIGAILGGTLLWLSHRSHTRAAQSR